MATLNIKNILTAEKNLVEAKSTGDAALSLSKVTASQLMQYYYQKSLFSKVCNNNLITSINSQKLTVMLNPTTVFKNRGTEIGAGNPDKLRAGKQVEVPWNESVYNFEAITEQERQLLPIDLLGAKLPRIYNDFMKMHERTAFKALENKIVKDKKATTYDYASKTPADFKKQITKLATQLTKAQSKEQGIDLIDRENIVIFVEPIAFDFLADAGLVGNRAKESIEGGQYSYGDLGGYKIYSNPYLQDFDVVITTDFVAVQAVNTIKVYMGPVDLASADKGVRAEFADLFGVLYDGLALGLSSQAQSAAKKENEYIQPVA
ncbi:hypothetical protein ACNQ2K_00235 [Mycoplasma sp. VS292A]|uniref:hypothetical protein n=1 Tax=Mycoplasma sp. VS292A TaxID=3401680 RepID=UPI003AB02ED4